MDDVTNAFKMRLRKLSGSEPVVYDFQFGSLPSAYKPLLHAVKAGENNLILCPGESTSMVTETLGYLPREKVVIMEVASMSSAHHQHLVETCKMGGVQVLKETGELTQSEAPVRSENMPIAAEQVCQEFCERCLTRKEKSALLFNGYSRFLETHFPDERSSEGWSPE